MNIKTLQPVNRTIYYSCNNDRDWSLNLLSGRCRNVTGYKRSELLSGTVTIGQLISEHFRESVWLIVQEFLSAKIPYVLNYTIDSKDNNKIIIYEHPTI